MQVWEIEAMDGMKYARTVYFNLGKDFRHVFPSVLDCVCWYSYIIHCDALGIVSDLLSVA